MKSTLFKFIVLLTLTSFFVACDSGTTTDTGNDSAEEETRSESEESQEIASDEAKEEITGPFGVKSGIITYEDKTLEGLVTANLTLYFDSYGSIIKLVETAGSATSVYLYNDLTKKGVSQHGVRKPVKIFMRQGEINRFVAQRSTSGYVQKENESIIGLECEVWENNAKSASGESQNVYWLHKGMVLKEINRLGSGYLFEAVKFEEAPVDQTIFSLADGAKSPHNIFE